MITLLKNLFSKAAGDERCVIEQQSYYDELAREKRRMAKLDEAVMHQQRIVATGVKSWAHDSINNRSRAPVIYRLTAEILEWLPGLGAPEITLLAQASMFDVQQHLFGSCRIPGVRRVRPLEECQLLFPRPVLNDGVGGTPRRMR
jgi:hypothetical protein